MTGRAPAVATALAGLAMNAGCATFFHTPLQAVEIATRPRGAVIARDGQAVGITPAALKVERSERRTTLHLSREGFLPDEVVLEREFNWASVAEDYGGWLLVTFLYNLAGHPHDSTSYLAASSVLQSLYFSNACFAVDALTGAVWKRTPRAAEVVLQAAPAEPSATLAVPAPVSATGGPEPAPAR